MRQKVFIYGAGSPSISTLLILNLSLRRQKPSTGSPSLHRTLPQSQIHSPHPHLFTPPVPCHTRSTCSARRPWGRYSSAGGPLLLSGCLSPDSVRRDMSQVFVPLRPVGSCVAAGGLGMIQLPAPVCAGGET